MREKNNTQTEHIILPTVDNKLNHAQCGSGTGKLNIFTNT